MATLKPKEFYSTKLPKKYPSKNGKKGKSRRHKKIKMPTQPNEINFNEDSRHEFVTGFRRRKQGRRIQAALELIYAQTKQKHELLQQKREENIEYLVKSGYQKDPIKLFLEDSNDDSDSDNDNIMDMDTFMSTNDDENNNGNTNTINEYHNNNMTTTVVTSVPQMKMDREMETINELKEVLTDMNTDKSMDKSNELNIKDKNPHKPKWDFKNINNQDSNENNDKINRLKKRQLSHKTDDVIYTKLKELKQTPQEMKSSKKKLKKMLAFVKEFGRSRKRRANRKHKKR